MSAGLQDVLNARSVVLNAEPRSPPTLLPWKGPVASNGQGRCAKVVRIAIDNVHPLTGTAAAGGGEALRFEGWLGLLRALSALIVTCDETGDRDETPEGA
jgi:hypothetical protein